MGLKKSQRGRIFSLRVKKGEEIQPHFRLMKKEGEKWVAEEEAETYEGRLKNIELDSYEYRPTKNKVETKHTVKMTFESLDDGVTEILGMNFNSLTLNLFNTIANEEQILDRVYTISVYVKDDYPKMYIKIDDEPGDWKLSIDQVKTLHERGHESWIAMFNKLIQPTLDKNLEEMKEASEEKLEESDVNELFRDTGTGGSTAAMEFLDDVVSGKKEEVAAGSEDSYNFADDLPF